MRHREAETQFHSLFRDMNARLYLTSNAIQLGFFPDSLQLSALWNVQKRARPKHFETNRYVQTTSLKQIYEPFDASTKKRFATHVRSTDSQICVAIVSCRVTLSKLGWYSSSPLQFKQILSMRTFFQLSRLHVKFHQTQPIS